MDGLPAAFATTYSLVASINSKQAIDSEKAAHNIRSGLSQFDMPIVFGPNNCSRNNAIHDTDADVHHAFRSIERFFMLIHSVASAKSCKNKDFSGKAWLRKPGFLPIKKSPVQVRCIRTFLGKDNSNN